MPDYELSPDPGRIQIDRVHRALAASYWSPGIRRELVERAIAGSIVIGAYERATGDQVAFARVVSDCATFAWLCDVYVDEAHRRVGLGKRMMEALLADPRLQTLRRWCLATRDAHGLYERYGFAPVPADRWMEKRTPKSVWSIPA
jgi:GNAT superfamily N-acetyltransferase